MHLKELEAKLSKKNEKKQGKINSKNSDNESENEEKPSDEQSNTSLDKDFKETEDEQMKNLEIKIKLVILLIELMKQNQKLFK